MTRRRAGGATGARTSRGLKRLGRSAGLDQPGPGAAGARMPRVLKRFLLWLFQVAERPEPPPGSPESLRVFRASSRYFGYSVLKWSIGQMFALVGLVGSAIGLGFVEFFEDHAVDAAFWFRFTEALAPLLIVLFLVQFAASFSVLRLGYEMRWYMVSDRALRIRYGIYSLREQTMTVVNIQNMAVKRGPLQRLFGIADLEIRTASGGGSDDDDEDSLSRGLLQGLDNAEEVRNLLLATLRQTRDSGLGDPDDQSPVPGVPSAPAAAVAPLARREDGPPSVPGEPSAAVEAVAPSTARQTPAPGRAAAPSAPAAAVAAARGDGGSVLAAAQELLAESRALRRLLHAGAS